MTDIEKLREAAARIREECVKEGHRCHTCPLFYIICYRDISPSSWQVEKIGVDKND